MYRFSNLTTFLFAILVAASASAMVVSRSDNGWLNPATLQNQTITTTNKIRSQHRVGAVTWNATLASAASKWASQCKFSFNNDPYGKNAGSGYNAPSDMINAWAAGEKYYNYSNPKFTSDSGAFSQLVWKSSTQIGCGVANCTKQSLRLLSFCYFSPPGNIDGQFAANVFKPQ